MILVSLSWFRKEPPCYKCEQVQKRPRLLISNLMYLIQWASDNVQDIVQIKEVIWSVFYIYFEVYIYV